MSYLLRDARPTDLLAVKRLASVLNTVNLPHDAEVLESLLDTSSRSFSQRIKSPLSREYLFVMEDTATGELVGTSQIIAQHGTREAPHMFYDVAEEERYSESIDRHFRHRTLRIGVNYDGPTEIGGLVLDPALRRSPGKLGKQLSFVRFLYMAMHRNWFRSRILAELLPPLLPDGASVLWEALGRRFTGLSYLEADRISKTNKEFIRGLFPSGHIYATLLSEEAQSVIGEVGANTEGVKKMLMSVGFKPVNRVDPFDGGPHFEANTDDVWPVTSTKQGTVRIVDDDSIREGAGESQDGLVAMEHKKKRGQPEKESCFRCLHVEFKIHGDKDDITIDVPRSAAAVLQATDGDTLTVLPMATHTRL
jgi:arginine N-succinyltransferase